MRERNNLRIDRFRNNSPEPGMLYEDSVGAGVKEIQPDPEESSSLIVNFGRRGLFAARIATCSAFLFLFAFLVLAAPAPSPAQVAVSVSVGYPPPALPVYVQPPCPGPGYIWVPGYWAWDPNFGYYWVPGTWVFAPFPGALWTPGYWGWNDGVYVWYEGYWGPVVGFYGGINYGCGYTGYGFHGGYWRHGAFYYNRAVNNVNVTNIHNVYNKTVINNVNVTRVSYNGGPGGVRFHPTAGQLAASRQRHSPPNAVQREQERSARSFSEQRATVNRGRPSIAATPKPGVFTGHGIERASRAGAPYKAPPTGHTAVPGAPHRAPHPGGVERGPAAAEPRHAAPSAVPR
ncbi:MAG TPA: hypothetical protein VFG19_05595, partial [Geobacteraceae bacterium]|nr:hypothetical protein [Geobacteraceae bacterium]